MTADQKSKIMAAAAQFAAACQDCIEFVRDPDGLMGSSLPEGDTLACAMDGLRLLLAAGEDDAPLRELLEKRLQL
ncbi:hypothetical protein [Oricola cellulosilytica]|uniref:Uncharacterized protein n=1 Tax=Oricola cellulosilytica TaxID=1429082 RepID=A0A4R0PEI0_9HYPH|nr:hypothetical protein [Oricola cellulosilytica]TCD15173.1 hypothetical protein E0D97_06385 [Oricola cellulosilytica]